MPGPLESHWGSHRKRVGCWEFNHRALAAQRSCARLGSKPCPAEEVGWDGCSQPLGLLSTRRGLRTWCRMSAGCDDVGRRSSLAADPLLSGFPTLPRPEVELLARWCRLQNLTRASAPGHVKPPFRRKGLPIVAPHLLLSHLPRVSSSSCGPPPPLEQPPAAVPSAAGLFLDPRPLERPRAGDSPAPLVRFMPLGRPRERPVGVERGTKEEKASGSVAPKFVVETCRKCFVMPRCQ